MKVWAAWRTHAYPSRLRRAVKACHTSLPAPGMPPGKWMDWSLSLWTTIALIFKPLLRVRL